MKDVLSDNFNVATASEDLKTAAYAQIALLLNNANLLDENTCYIQTTSGGVGPAGFLEGARLLAHVPEILVVQPENGHPGPLVDALLKHAEGENPFTFLRQNKYSTSMLEPTLGSTKPLYALQKLVHWREEGGSVITVSVSKRDLFRQKSRILTQLVKLGIYPNPTIGTQFFQLEKSGFICITGAIKVCTKHTSI